MFYGCCVFLINFGKAVLEDGFRRKCEDEFVCICIGKYVCFF